MTIDVCIFLKFVQHLTGAFVMQILKLVRLHLLESSDDIEGRNYGKPVINLKSYSKTIPMRDPV